MSRGKGTSDVARIKLRWNGEVESSEEQQRLKRRVILREAGRAFNERGFHNVSLDEVALELGISKTVFYYYFRNKNDVLLSCVEIGFELAEEALRAAETQEGTGLDRIATFVRTYVEGINSELGTCAVFSELNSLHPDDLKKVRKRQRMFGRRVMKLVTQGIADGSVAVEDVKSAAGWIISPPLMMPRVPEFWRDRSGAQLATWYADFARRALMPPRG
ncbi:TetR/AcrR family transcriptional regulator [Vineibacter terrae]|uniref:TetR/AcrR family transcriptional regulator n=1 Tax=Vineibacter terrae TaxID=2586908 RepID=A0A5C8PKL0_9HYPH|nr:TetR/AcrR family transcriptional regulator [Vineibacter terrae]